jgi:uncharacterized phage protein (TIGR02220 family)
MSDKLVYKIVEYLNQVAGTNYSPSYPETVKEVNQLISIGYGYDDFVSVVDKKYKQWKGTKFEQYLRPSTLFGKNFENYLNEPERIKPNPISNVAQSVQGAKRYFRGMDKK